MAHEELQGDFCSSNSWSSSIRCGNNLSCSMAVAAGDIGGSFGWFPAMDLQPQLSGFDLSPSSVDWSQSFLESSENDYFQSTSLMSHGFFVEDQILQQSNTDEETQMLSTFGFSSEVDHQSLFYSGKAGISQLCPSSMEEDDQNPKLPEITKALATDQQQDFENSSFVWNALANSGRSIINSDATEKANSKASRDSMLPRPKKLRIETHSTLPSFKIRKEKLGDRITALQQLVSPFGKTDTASVLHEAVEYIKFLHEQVGALSNSYVRNGHQRNQHMDLTLERKRNKDLRSRGLCLVQFVSDEILQLNFWDQLWREL